MKIENFGQSSLGMIGLGTMGSNLLQNIADHGFICSGYDINPDKVASLNNLKSERIQGFSNLNDFAKSLKSPRTVMMLVPAGPIVDDVIEELVTVLEFGDIIIDGGNSHFTDTERRNKELEKKGFHFIGMGVSGGEEGARQGPSMMPGGDKKAYEKIEPVLKKIAAQVDGEPTVAYMGVRSAGHFVKMVHNGIEYALMQLISETYEILKSGLNLNSEEIHQVFEKWTKGRLNSYLLDITGDIFSYKNKGDKHILLSNIRDEAKAKGTGKWTSQAAMDLNLPIPMIDVSVSTRDLSKYKELRTRASRLYSATYGVKHYDRDESYIDTLEQAFFFGMVSAYSQGMHLLYRANVEFKYQLNLHIIAKIWRGGCIIRSAFLEDIFEAYNENPDLKHLFMNEKISSHLKDSLPNARTVVADAVLKGISVSALSAALSYFDNFRSEDMPTNLIQAQRDYFGSHTYELKGKKGVFHSKWVMENRDVT